MPYLCTQKRFFILYKDKNDYWNSVTIHHSDMQFIPELDKNATLWAFIASKRQTI